jgi:hypothetical protein
VIDLHLWLFVGVLMGQTSAVKLVTTTLMMTVWRRGKPHASLHRFDPA